MDAGRLSSSAFVLEMNPAALIDYVKICNRVSLIGQGQYESVGLNETIRILGKQYRVRKQFFRGQGQISGYLFIHMEAETTKLLAVFAGTSTKYDAVCATILKETGIHNIHAHGGISFLVYQNLADLGKIVEFERFSGSNVDIILAGHSLGGAIAQLGAYDLKVRWSGDSGVRIRSLNLAGPSPFRTGLKDKVEDVIGYNNMMSVMRRADYIYQLCESVDLMSAGPTIYLKDRQVEEPDVVKRVKKQFGHNHYVSEYVNDLLNHSSDEVWAYLALIKTRLEIEKKLKLEQFLLSRHE